MWSVPLGCLLPRPSLSCLCVAFVQSPDLESDISLQSHYTKYSWFFRAPSHIKIRNSINLICAIDYIIQKNCLGNYFCVDASLDSTLFTFWLEKGGNAARFFRGIFLSHSALQICRSKQKEPMLSDAFGK